MNRRGFVAGALSLLALGPADAAGRCSTERHLRCAGACYSHFSEERRAHWFRGLALTKRCEKRCRKWLRRDCDFIPAQNRWVRKRGGL